MARFLLTSSHTPGLNFLHYCQHSLGASPQWHYGLLSNYVLMWLAPYPHLVFLLNSLNIISIVITPPNFRKFYFGRLVFHLHLTSTECPNRSHSSLCNLFPLLGSLEIRNVRKHATFVTWPSGNNDLLYPHLHEMSICTSEFEILPPNALIKGFPIPDLLFLRVANRQFLRIEYHNLLSN